MPSVPVNENTSVPGGDDDDGNANYKSITVHTHFGIVSHNIVTHGLDKPAGTFGL